MSDCPVDTVPCAAYAEDVQEDTQTTIPGTKQSAQVKTKKSKRDAASDSGYSSRTAATNGTQSTSGSSRLLSFVGKMTGSTKKSSKATIAAAAAPISKTSSKKTTPKTKEALRVKTNVESREDAARIQLSGEPLQRTTSGRSYETSPRLSRSVKPSPTLAQQQPSVRTAPPLRVSMTRPMSYHAGTSNYGSLYRTVSYSPSMAIPTYPQLSPPQHYQQPHMTYVSSMSPTMGLPRQAAYPFEPTLPSQYIPTTPGWEPAYHSPFIQSQPSQPPLPRRYSMAGPSPQTIVEYPMVPTRVTPRPPVSYHNSTSYPPTIADEGIYMEDNEAYYRRKEEARRKMPPPQRPVMRHASTTSAVKKSNRDSLEYQPRTSTSSRTESFGSHKEEGRVPLMSRGSSSKNVPMRVVEAPPSPERTRRARPQSYHAEMDPETAAERYQARHRGATEPQPFVAYDVEKVNKVSSKARKSKTSDSGSRSSDGKKESSIKKRPEARPKPHQGDGLSLEVVEGCTATLRRNSQGYVVRVSLNEDQKGRGGRPSEREATRDGRRYSASSRRESISEAIVRGIAPRRPSSSHPSRRERMEDTTDERIKLLTEKYKSVDDTAVEDEEYSEPEIRKKRSEKHEKLTAQRLQRLKPSSESRQSSRSARSGKSAKSSKSVTSNMKGVNAEGRPF